MCEFYFTLGVPQAFLDRIVGVGAAAPEPGFKNIERWWSDKADAGVERGGEDLFDTLAMQMSWSARRL